ncbi:HutD/Ves family protein [Serratia entomophila]|uniref:HutD/Ves family protein n=1 Tax=Serratia entomophila TaxID=42906 RepID=UPI002179339F|nr:HutD family protein [Serratia entomophila]CAI0745976.1 Various environmental stresses-induced protein [Serratia entomophila]CAI0833542.1 Various environmental stresses-induced protein [Serratia entomophila]CAI0833923.1 Various environmental stresses-induced protein [Serratia entomophila]CAI1559704.1 Various environmental stresses-induced protein [Serratia entomophila]CAI1585458.1 Various environmental stresses-induced protein [Serratia entomophila]
MSLTRFDFAALPVSPWRNGGGETREIACWPPGAQAFEWRASIATIAQDGPFSAFAGIDRSITLLEGDGVRLFSAGHIDHALARVGEPFAFSGDVALNATLLGGESQDFNIMTRRGRRAAEVRRVAQPVVLPAGHAGVLYVLSGEWSLPGGVTLGARQGGWWPEDTFSGALKPLRQDSVILWADITAAKPE